MCKIFILTFVTGASWKRGIEEVTRKKGSAAKQELYSFLAVISLKVKVGRCNRFGLNRAFDAANWVKDPSGVHLERM